MSKLDSIFKKYNKDKEKLKKELLISLLDEIGYKGIDVSAEDAFDFEYNLINYKNQYIAHFNGKYRMFDMDKEKIEYALDLISDSFYSYVETTKKEYLLLLNDEDNFPQIVNDIYDYDNTLLLNNYFQYPLSINDLINYLKTILKIKEHVQ